MDTSNVDIHGTMRGKCNKCSECKSFMVTSKKQVRCEYCDHTPTDHVRIIKLGACTSCNDCNSYMPETPTEYSNCQYCDCPASSHKGADQLRKPKCSPHALPPTQPIAPTTAIRSAPQLSIPAGHAGICKYPNCPYPKYIEGTRIHDFCSKTCASKYQILQSQGLPIGTPAQYTAAYGVAGRGSTGAGAALSGPINAFPVAPSGAVKPPGK